MDAKILDVAQYYITFLYDHSRKLQGFTSKEKRQMLDIFKQFHATIERDIGRKLKWIHTDNGSEYRVLFEEYYRVHRDRLKNVSQTPQHNEVAK